MKGLNGAKKIRKHCQPRESLSMAGSHPKNWAAECRGTMQQMRLHHHLADRKAQHAQILTVSSRHQQTNRGMAHIERFGKNLTQLLPYPPHIQLRLDGYTRFIELYPPVCKFERVSAKM